MLLCAMILVYGCLVTMNLIGRGNCGIVPSGGPGTVSQLQFGIIQSRLGSGNCNAEDGRSDGLASAGDGGANDNMTQDDGSSSPESKSALSSNTEK